MSKRKDVIRDGDIVKITTPNVFIRCGYPLTKKMIMERFTKEQKEAVVQMLLAFGLKRPPEHALAYELSWKMDSTLADKAFDDVIYLMSGVLLKREGWGGRERMIHYEYKPEYQDVICEVRGKKVVKTGTYAPGGRSYDYDYYSGYDDYDPPYLRNEQTHVILKVYAVENLNNENSYGREIEIEKVWVEKFDREKLGHSPLTDFLFASN